MNQEELKQAFEEAKAAGDFENAYAIEQQMKSTPVDFSAGAMVKNIPSSAANYASDIYQTARHPIETGSAVIGLGESLVNKAGRNLAEMTTGKDIQPKPGSEDAADQFGQFFRDRYGSVDAFKKTLMEDPVGVLADVASFAGVAKLPKIGKLGEVVAAAEPLNVATNAGKTVAKLVIPEKAAAKLYQSAAKFSPALKPEKRAAAVNTALDQGIMPTARGAEKLDMRINALNQSLDDLINKSFDSGVAIPVDKVLRHVEELRRKKGGRLIEAPSDTKAIDKIVSQFKDAMDGRKFMTVEEVQKFKTDLYDKINFDAKRLQGTPIKEDTYKTLARGAKDAIVEAIPDAADINKSLSELYQLQPHLVRAVSRLENRNLVSINTPLNIGAGAAAGAAANSTGLGVGVALIANTLGNPKTKAAVAIALNKLKTGDVKWLQNNIGRTDVRVALALAGRYALANGETNTNQQ